MKFFDIFIDWNKFDDIKNAKNIYIEYYYKASLSSNIAKELIKSLLCIYDMILFEVYVYVTENLNLCYTVAFFFLQLGKNQLSYKP